MTLTPEQAQRLAGELFDVVEMNLGNGDEAAPVGQADSEPLPEFIGQYRILQKLGGGGMGTVYEAQQQRPHRIVALKVIAPWMIASDRRSTALQRFEFEAEILGELHHPGIAQVYEAGMHDTGDGGLPFLVMEFIPGALPITKFADRQDLTVRERLELFASVCDAIHHAHQKGVIHRDLKPGNILVDAEGRVKVIDFGIARATNAEHQTLTVNAGDVREILGTLQYMSPEQACPLPSPTGRGVGGEGVAIYSHIDTRTDIYSLGVILYELLCGRLPHDLSNTPLAYATRIIQEQEPAPPSAIRRSLRGDLEAITLKALEKVRERRYQSAADFVADIRRYLKGEPVEARRPSQWMRAVKWVGRHPVASGAVLSLTMICGSVLLTLLTLWWNVQPARFGRISDDGTTVYIESRSGTRLTRFGGTHDNQVYIATVASRPAMLGGGAFALYSIGGQSGDYPTEAQLVVARLSDLEEVLWRTDSTSSFLNAPPPLTSQANRFVARQLLLADVFSDADLPGEELVVVHAGHGTPGSGWCIRVYDWNRRVLFEAWHLGMISDIEWMPEAGLLLCAGDRHGVDWDAANRWIGEHEGVVDAGFAQGDYPQFVAALRPERGTQTTWIHEPEAQAVEWYKIMKPLYAFEFDLYQVSNLLVLTSKATTAQVNIRLRDGSHGVGMAFDTKGELVSIVRGDAIKRIDPSALPVDFEDIGLMDPPPVFKSMERIGRDFRE